MIEHTLQCQMIVDDYAEAHTDEDGDVRLEVHAGGESTFIYARPAEFAAWANAVLADTGERVGDDGTDVGVGDYVEITKYRSSDRRYVGVRGRVEALDTDDIPYFVRMDDGCAAWVMEVRRVAPPATSNPFASHIDEAKRLLAGTSPTAADVIDLARELADRA